jgi:hypothetical protein
MSTLHVSHRVDCAVAQAPEFLERFFEEHAKDGVVTIALRAPINLPGIPTMALSRDCVVRIERSPHRGELDVPYAVSWEPASGGPFPRFLGSIVIGNDEDYDRCILSLDGTYEPPFGLAGAAFDAEVGHAVAESTGLDLLQRIGTFVEQSYRAVESAKAMRRAATT